MAAASSHITTAAPALRPVPIVRWCVCARQKIMRGKRHALKRTRVCGFIDAVTNHKLYATVDDGGRPERERTLYILVVQQVPVATRKPPLFIALQSYGICTFSHTGIPNVLCAFYQCIRSASHNVTMSYVIYAVLSRGCAFTKYSTKYAQRSG